MTDPFSKLPLFATDKEIAVAIVGPKRAAEWLKSRLPTLAARPGFPKIDEFHGGRAVPRVKLFYEEYLGITAEHPGFAQDGKEDWSGSRIRTDRKARAKANSDAWAEKKRKALEDFRALKVDEVTRTGATRILTRKEAAEMCKLTPAGFDVWVRKGIMPPATPGTRRWDQRAIDAALDRLSGLGGDTDRSEDPYTNWKRTSGQGTNLSSSASKVGKGGYPIPSGPNDPLKQEYEELGFDPVTMGEKEMMELLKAADERWRASIPDTPLGKREIRTILQLADAGVGVAINADEIKGCRNDTEARLEARGFIVLRKSKRFPDQVESYLLTEEGLAAAKQIEHS